MEILDRPNPIFNRKPDFGEIFGESKELYQKLFGYGAIAVLIYLVASAIVGFVFESATGLNALSQQLAEELEGSRDFNTIYEKAIDFYSDNTAVALITRFGTDFILLLSFPLAGGFMLVCREMDRDGFSSVSTLFEGFKPYYWSRLMVLALIYFVLSKIGLFLFVIPGIYIWVAAVLGCPFVMFGGKGGVDVLKSSVNLVNQNWFEVFKILLVATLIGWAGYLICCVGRVFTYPFVFVTVYMLYKHMVGFDDDPISEIGEN